MTKPVGTSDTAPEADSASEADTAPEADNAHDVHASAAGEATENGASTTFDVAIVGGGLSGAFIAKRLREKRGDVRVAVVERGPALGGNHTWSFHSGDLPPTLSAWVEPLAAYRWPRQQVRFPSHRRTLETGYRSIVSERLHADVAPKLGPDLFVNAGAAEIGAAHVTLDDGRTLAARAVIDARGQRASSALTLGYQKFLGQEIAFSAPHGLVDPIIMDATISQSDGYRFIYVLPFTEDTALIEDTYYADGANLDRDAVRREIAAYCARAGWKVREVLREEEGVLPIALAGDIRAYLNAAPAGVGLAGLGAGLFHPLTGYSLPDAAELAEKIADAPDLSGPALAALSRTHAEEKWRERAFYRLLSRFLYYAARPETRYKVLGRFYRLSQPLIERFYASRSTPRDKLRVLVGKPPVSFFKAVECVNEKRWLEKHWRPKLERLAAAGE